MLKQDIKTINAEFIRTHALFQLSFVQFRPYATSSLGLLLSLMLMPKSKMILETSLDFMPSFKSSFDTRVEGLISNVDYLGNRHRNFIQKKYRRNKRLPHTHVFFLYKLFTPFVTPRKYIGLSPSSLNSFYYFFIFWFKGLTQFMIEFWPPLNGGQLVLE